ncbi:MAG: DUF2007 domain-containing protein [Bacteroidetes bacterium]|nr:DUF2007 domain-containing protein [Bacteroidota bacterium]
MDFEKNWDRVMSDPDMLKVELAESVLKQHNIVSHVVNNSNSAIPSIGQVELFTRKEDAEEARKVLKKAEMI